MCCIGAPCTVAGEARPLTGLVTLRALGDQGVRCSGRARARKPPGSTKHLTTSFHGVAPLLSHRTSRNGASSGPANGHTPTSPSLEPDGRSRDRRRVRSRGPRSKAMRRRLHPAWIAGPVHRTLDLATGPLAGGRSQLDALGDAPRADKRHERDQAPPNRHQRRVPRPRLTEKHKDTAQHPN